jgi:hypothetical protein
LTDEKLPTTLDYRDRFAKFQATDPYLWNPPRDGRELVRPSGELDSPIAHHLHNPSFYTNDFHGIETVDPTNACIDLVMRNGFEKDRTLIFGQLSR